MRAFGVLVATVLVAVGIGLGVLAGTGNDAAGPVGEVCGYVVRLGGPISVPIKVSDPALLHHCPVGTHSVAPFKLLASNGSVFQAYEYRGTRGWSAQVPPGVYRGIDRPGCTNSAPASPFVVTTSNVLVGVPMYVGCDFI